MPSNPMLPNNPHMKTYKPSGKGTLIADLIKKHNNKSENDNKSQKQSKIKKLADDVNISLHELEQCENTRTNINYNQVPEYSVPINNLEYDNIQEDDDMGSVETNELYNDYVNIFIEMLLLLSIYVVMSQPFVVYNVSKYINQLNPTEDGIVKLSGIIIYGLILTILFFVLRNIVLKKLR